MVGPSEVLGQGRCAAKACPTASEASWHIRAFRGIFAQTVEGRYLRGSGAIIRPGQVHCKGLPRSLSHQGSLLLHQSRALHSRPEPEAAADL